MDPNLCPDGAGFDDLLLGFHSKTIDYPPDFLIQGFDKEITTIQQPPINIGSESYQGGMGHFDQEFTNFPRPLMDQNLGPNFPHLLDHSIRFDPQNLGANFSFTESYQGGMGHFDQEFTNFQRPFMDQNLGPNFSHLLDQTVYHPIPSDPQAAPCFTTPELPGNIGSDQYSGMIFESGLGSTQSLRPPRTYQNFSREDVEELILAVEKSGTRISWKKISQLPYFKEQGRTDLQLLNKWRHMTETDDDKKDPKMKDLYIRAKDVKRIRGEMK